MKINLAADHKDFVKQVGEVRGFLNKQELAGRGAAPVSARFCLASLMPFLPVLRTELRGEPDPPAILTATSDLIANLAMTVIQSMYDAPEEAQRELLDRIIGTAHGTALAKLEADARMERDAAEASKPKLAVLNLKAKPILSVIDGGKNGGLACVQAVRDRGKNGNAQG